VALQTLCATSEQLLPSVEISGSDAVDMQDKQDSVTEGTVSLKQIVKTSHRSGHSIFQSESSIPLTVVVAISAEDKRIKHKRNFFMVMIDDDGFPSSKPLTKSDAKLYQKNW
jgi:hypothetical protein